MRIIWIGNLKDSLEIIQSTPEKEIRMLMICRIMHVRNVGHVHKIEDSINHIGMETLHLQKVIKCTN